jgi:hypothetical protein
LKVDDTYKRLQSTQEINPSQAQVYKDLKDELMDVIDVKIPSLIKTITDLAGHTEEQSVIKLNQDFAAFEAKEKTRLYRLVQLIAEKTSAPQFSGHGRSSGRSEAVHLKKADPPTFSGQEVDFPEFYRKWLAIVGPARLPEEAEVDRLRDALPKEAEEMLTGVSKVSRAWDILRKRFGDEDLIATKLKNELKALTITVKLDHEKIISLVIKVRSLMTRLDTLKASEALKYDGEFVSAIYFQLPYRHKQEWLKFDKKSYGDKWSALMAFLEESYDNAVQEKLLLASLTLLPNHGNKSGSALWWLVCSLPVGGLQGIGS